MMAVEACLNSRIKECWGTRRRLASFQRQMLGLDISKTLLSDSLTAPEHGQKNKLRHRHEDVMKHEVTESNHSGVCLCASLSSGLIVFAEVLRP